MTPNTLGNSIISNGINMLAFFYTTLKILSFLYRGVPVQVRPRAPSSIKSNTYVDKTLKLRNLKKRQKVSFRVPSDTTMTPFWFSFFSSSKITFKICNLRFIGGIRWRVLILRKRLTAESGNLLT